jgi:hypothetical protein
MIQAALSNAAAALDAAQGQIPSSDTVTVTALQGAYQAIAAALEQYTGQ